MTETTIKERPIIMTGESVRAILRGRKTQTRRVIDSGCNYTHGDFLLGAWGLSRPPYQFEGGPCPWRWRGNNDPKPGDWIEELQTDVDDHETCPVRCPFAIGQRLWVRETWCPRNDVDPITAPSKAVHYLLLKADYDVDKSMEWHSYGPWRSPIHMPRWASRLTLEITDVRVQRLHDISEEDAAAEGVIELRPTTCSARDDYRATWDAINGKKHPWESNPWIWALTFRMIKSCPK